MPFSNLFMGLGNLAFRRPIMYVTYIHSFTKSALADIADQSNDKSQDDLCGLVV